MPEALRTRIVSALPKELLIDLVDMATARTRSAFELIWKHTDLTGSRARGLEGQARFLLAEKDFEDVCILHEGALLDGGTIPGKGMKIFQHFMRFGALDGLGVVLGLASMPARAEIPGKNKSRFAGVSLNPAI